MTIQEMIDSIRGSRIVTFVSITDPDWASIKSTGPNPFKDTVKKRSVVNGMIGFIYENSVNRQRFREGLETDFESFPRKWGTRLHGTPWVEHNGKRYLEVKVERVLSTEYIDQDGNIIQPETIRPFLKPKNTTSRQGVENEIILRDYALNNIVELRLNGNVLAA